MRILPYILILFAPLVFGQHGVQQLYEELPADSVVPLMKENHTAFQPQSRWHNVQDYNLFVKLNSRKGMLFGIDPLLDVVGMNNREMSFRSGGGLQLESAFKKPWYVRLNLVGGIGQLDSTFAPRSWITNADSMGAYSYFDIIGRVSYTPNSVFNFQAGLDHNFVGEGNRSLFLGDHGKPYPFAKLSARFWRVEYTTMYQFMHEGDLQNYESKFGATHHISFNAAKWLNFGVFETVIFQPRDTAMQRGFEVEYLNPVIFYRPQEYALGSSDNVLLGASMTAKYKGHTLYAQLVIDEFSLTELRARSGWWANKFGAQFGIKGRLNSFGMKSFYRLEYNFLRPYTYAHLTAGQNYGNMGFSLAHPYGANVMEILGEYKVQGERSLFKFFVSYFLLGLDKDGFSYGSDVYRPYTQRPFEYDHHIGQGKGNNGLRVMLSASYQILKRSSIQAFTEQHMRYDSAFDRVTYMPVLGLRSNFRNDHRNY